MEVGPWTSHIGSEFCFVLKSSLCLRFSCFTGCYSFELQNPDFCMSWVSLQKMLSEFLKWFFVCLAFGM